jgi:histidinol-phosphate aminotransferase
MSAADPPLPRSALSALPAYRPGKAAEVAMQEHDLSSAVKLASNENPYDPLPSVRAALAEASTGMNRYPDHRATAVGARTAELLGLDVGQVGVGCGSVGLLQQLVLTYAGPGDEVVYGWRSFEAYPIFTRVAGATAVEVPLRRHTVDLEAIGRAVTERTRLVLVTSPNNPTGTVVDGRDLARLLDLVPPSCLVVLDEAYHEYLTGSHAPEALALLAAHPNLAVLRTFSKAYGLAALRIGLLLAHPAVVAAVDTTLVPFAVNGLAQVAALASLTDAAAAELGRRVQATIAERHRVARELSALGLAVPDPQANFVWLPAGTAAVDLTLALERQGVVTRPFPDEGVRVTVGAPDENDRFLTALSETLAPLDLHKAWQLPTGDAARKVRGWFDRIDDAQRRLVAHAATRHDGLTEPDPGGTERWDTGQVWAHLAEIGDYWQGQLALVVDAHSDAPVPFGRVKTDLARIAAIEAGRTEPVQHQLPTVLRSLDALRQVLAGFDAADWGRVGRHSTLGDLDVEAQLQHFHIGHVEEHLTQLDALEVTP